MLTLKYLKSLFTNLCIQNFNDTTEVGERGEVEPKRVAILGDGQLGMLSAKAAEELGHDVMVFGDVGENSPAGQNAEYTSVKIKEKEDRKEIARTVAKIIEYKPDVVTVEWENVPYQLAKAIEDAGITMYPNSRVLDIIQHRATEKQAVLEAGYSTTQFEKDINSEEELRAAFKKLGKGRLKTAREGYDGKGQTVIETEADIDAFLQKIASGEEKPLGEIERIFEQHVDFDFELSVIVARRPGGETITFEPAHNIHKGGILDQSIIPAIDSDSIQGKINQEIVDKAKKAAEEITNKMGVVGLLAVEMFVKDGEIIVNELAPRPHNSGHGTIESYNISQYHAHIMAILDEDFDGLRLESGSELQNYMGNSIKDMPERDSDGKSKIIQGGDTTHYDYGKGIDNVDGDYSSTRKCGHKTTKVPLKHAA